MSMSPEDEAVALALLRDMKAELDGNLADLRATIASCDRTLAIIASMDARMHSMGDRTERIAAHLGLDKDAGR